MDVLVSILIPAYNADKWIRATINSAIGQTWKNKEIIIVDDGSTDNTYEIAKRYESNQVKIIQQENRGASAARNKALSIAQGDFIQWLDADDILAPDKLEIQLSNSDRDPDTRILHSSTWGSFYHRLQSAKFKLSSLSKDLPPRDWLINYLEKSEFIANCSWLVSRKLTQLAGPWDERLSLNDDGEYFTRVVCCSERVKFHKNAVSYYRKGNPQSLSRSISVSEKALQSLSLSINLSIDHMLKLEDSERTNLAAVKVLNIMLSLIPAGFTVLIEQNTQRIYSLGGRISPINTSKKYILIKNLLGLETARNLQNISSHMQIFYAKFIEKLKAAVFRDGV